MHRYIGSHLPPYRPPYEPHGEGCRTGTPPPNSAFKYRVLWTEQPLQPLPLLQSANFGVHDLKSEFRKALQINVLAP